jgi:hypothetical protein
MTVAITEPGVFLSAKVCAAIRHPLQRDLRAALREQAVVAPEIADAIALVDNVGAWWEARHVAVATSTVDTRRCEAVEWGAMTVSATSAELKITPQAVKGLIKRGTIHAEKVDGSWRICSQSVTTRLKGKKCEHMTETSS